MKKMIIGLTTGLAVLATGAVGIAAASPIAADDPQGMAGWSGIGLSVNDLQRDPCISCDQIDADDDGICDRWEAQSQASVDAELLFTDDRIGNGFVDADGDGICDRWEARSQASADREEAVRDPSGGGICDQSGRRIHQRQADADPNDDRIGLTGRGGNEGRQRYGQR